MLAVLALFGILFLYLFTGIFSLHRRSLDWNGEGSMLKTPRTYRAKFFSLTDVLMLVLICLAIAIFSISFSIKDDLIAKFLVVFVAIFSGVRQIAGHAALFIKSTTFDQLLLWWATRRFTTCCTPSFVHRCPERLTLSWITTR